MAKARRKAAAEAPIEMTIDGRRSAFRVPGHVEVALAPHTFFSRLEFAGP